MTDEEINFNCMTDEEKGSLNAKIMGGLTFAGLATAAWLFFTSGKKRKSLKGLSSSGTPQENFEEYFLKSIDGTEYGKDLKTSKEKLDFLWTTFQEEKGYEIKRAKNWKKVFTDWCQGLPTSINLAYNDSDIEDLMWLFGYKFKEEDVVEKYWQLLPVVFESLMKKNKVNKTLGDLNTAKTKAGRVKQRKAVFAKLEKEGKVWGKNSKGKRKREYRKL